jgi:hypothetical protein
LYSRSSAWDQVWPLKNKVSDVYAYKVSTAKFSAVEDFCFPKAGSHKNYFASWHDYFASLRVRADTELGNYFLSKYGFGGGEFFYLVVEDSVIRSFDYIEESLYTYFIGPIPKHNIIVAEMPLYQYPFKARVEDKFDYLNADWFSWLFKGGPGGTLLICDSPAAFFFESELGLKELAAEKVNVAVDLRSDWLHPRKG